MFFIFINRNLTRVKGIVITFIAILLVLTTRLFFLQVYPSEKVTSQYQNHQSRNISDCRYNIVDANGKNLIKYNKKYYVVIDAKPFSLNNYEETLENLMAFNFIMKEENANFSYTDVMKSGGEVYEISEETYNKIDKLNSLKGVYTYSYDEIDKKEAWNVSTILSKLPESDSIVKGSLDWELNNYLKDNVIPKKNFYLDAKAVYSQGELETETKENKNLKLTIDKDIEEKIRGVLSKEEFNSLDNVGVILMEADTGKIKAMVQKDESKPNINLGIEGSGYEPGSVFKLITLGTALDKGIITMNSTYTCTGQICKNGAHGKLTVTSAIEKSCNDIFAKIGNEVGYDTIIDYCKDSGLFNRVLNLQGEIRNETTGIMPSNDMGMNNISIGQCLTVSPLQILGATNSFVNDGVYVKPYIVDSVIDYDGKEVNKFNTESKKVYSKTTAKIVMESMKGVVKNGTGKNAQVKGVEIGGKTGSATSGDGNTHGWFLGYFKNNKKLYSMVVFVPDINGKDDDGADLGGGNTAAPIFRDIVKELVYE